MNVGVNDAIKVASRASRLDRSEEILLKVFIDDLLRARLGDQAGDPFPIKPTKGEFKRAIKVAREIQQAALRSNATKTIEEYERTILRIRREWLHNPEARQMAER